MTLSHEEIPPKEERKVSYCVNGLLCSSLLNEGHDNDYCVNCKSSLLIGDRYRAIRLLRPYGNSEKQLYEAVDQETGEHVALKVINWHLSKTLRFLKREHHFLCRAGSPFPRLKEEDYFSWAPDKENDFYEVFVLVLPLVPGINSEQWVKKNSSVSEEQAVEWIIQAAKYLERLTYIGYIHRDIKPSNFMVDQYRQLTLIDFESVRKMDQDYLSGIDEMSWDDDQGEYRRFTKFFSLGYTAPEQIRGLPLPQSDFYALGRTAMYWVTGIESTKLGDGMDNRTINWSEINPDLSETFINFLNGLTNKAPNQRPLTASQIIGFLETTYPELHATEQLLNSLEEKRFKFSRRGIGLFAACVVGGLGVWYGISQHFFGLGVEAFERTQYKQAETLLSKSVTLNPLHGGAYYYLGLSCHRNRDLACAEKNYLKSIKHSFNPTGGQYQMGVLKEKQQKYDVARRYYQKSIVSGENAESYNRLARLEIKQGNIAQGQKLVEQGLKIADDDDMKARLLAQQGRIYYENQEWTKAEKVLQESGELFNTAESVCLLPKISEKLNRPQVEIDGRWYTCFYSPNEYIEGADYKAELLKKALPSLFPNE